MVMVAVGYFLGSLPFGLIAGRVFRRVDIRRHGSGKTGMTNVLRTVGAPAAALVLLLDMGKAVLVVVLARILSDERGVEVAAALAALVGHNWSPFIGFRGGRGTAPGWGSLLILSPVSGLVATVVGVPLVGLTRYVSLGSVTATIAGCVTLVVLSATGHAPLVYVWFAAIGGTLVVGRHRDNIWRLLRGQERKIGQRAEGVPGEAKPARRKGLRWPRSA